MPIPKWISFSLDNLRIKKEEEKNELIRFWNEFYNYILNNNKDELQSKTKAVQYKEEVFDILHNAKARAPLSEEELHKIQTTIEDHTMLFDEPSMHKSVPNIIRILIRKNDKSAKDYLRSRDLQKDDIELLSEFGQYTIEALIVHVLSIIFNSNECSPIIRVASLVERLEHSVRTQASLLKCRRCKILFSMAADKNVLMSGKDIKRSKLERLYPFGSGLVQFMEERGLIGLRSDLSGTVGVKKKKGHYYLPSHLYAVCNFDISLLPIKLNLPMVCKPVDWASACPSGQNPITLSDLSGGYLSSPTGEIYDRYRLLSSGDINNFYIDIGKDDNYKNLCRVMNKLQSQAFQINSDLLKYIQSKESSFVEYGYLMPGFLATMNIKDVSSILRDFHMKDDVINKLYSFSELLNTLCKNIQRARYERLIIKLAIAYEGYHFYLPAFLDFRGRIYRCGILHFHERDLARSLIVFADSTYKDIINKDALFAATAYHYKPFGTPVEAYDWLSNNISSIDENTIAFSRGAKRPFQFISNFIRFKDSKSIDQAANTMPITQDASASAYQIMSYFLLDDTLAMRTNLIPSTDGQIQDVYSFILEELKEFLKEELENNLSTIVCNGLTRKLVKSIFMPLIYGKTIMSTADDLKDELSHFITYKECFKVASACFKFWRTKYHGMECLIKLIRNIGWFAAARECPVFYRVPYFTTVQDYMINVPINIWVYDRLHKKRRRVTLRVSSSKRDRRKTEISTFVNFIHQRDAHIAMSVVEEMLSIGAPVYTVHDNFITTAQYSNYIPMIYSNVFCTMGPPLSIINDIIYMNVIKPIVKRGLTGHPEGYFANKVIQKETLHYYLKANVPENISKNMMATWDERITGILKSYAIYTRNVCIDSQSPSWKAHEQKWEKFMLKLKIKGGYPSYCVHY